MGLAVLQTTLDNRELALLSWVGVALLVVVTYGKTRSSLPGVFKALLAPKLLGVFALMAGYVALLVYLLWLSRVWTTDLISETVLWYFGPAVILFSRFDKAPEDPDFFKHSAMAAVKFTVVIEFAINLYPTHLALELLLIPIVTFLSLVVVVARRQPDSRPAERAGDFLLALIGLALFSYTIGHIIRDPQDFATLDSLREFVVPILLTLAFVPFVYVVALYATYDRMFVRLGWQLREKKLVRYAKRRALRSARFRLSTVRRFEIGLARQLNRTSDRSDVDRAVTAITLGEAA